MTRFIYIYLFHKVNYTIADEADRCLTLKKAMMGDTKNQKMAIWVGRGRSGGQLLDSARIWGAVSFFLVAVSFVCTGCGAGGGGGDYLDGNQDASLTYDRFCQLGSDRRARCEERFEYKSAEKCASKISDRHCFDMMLPWAKQAIQTALLETACQKGKPIMTGVVKDAMFESVQLKRAVRKKQNACFKKMSACELDPREYCVAPFVVPEIEARIWQCTALPCNKVRQCVRRAYKSVGCN